LSPTIIEVVLLLNMDIKIKWIDKELHQGVDNKFDYILGLKSFY
jgi:hypothetical protein